ncbi:hypothetical protein I552_8072 [Mycobacterium xenopi 3993]|nr:hypothetical protein I552_8072 [Mycobacterium xenopi 3993]
MAGDRCHSGVRLRIGPDRVVDGVTGRGGHAVVAGLALKWAVGLGVAASQHIADDVAYRNVLHGRQSRFLQR